MDRYQFSPQELQLMECSPVPFAVYQFLGQHVVTLALSQGFCDLFGYGEDRQSAYHDMDYNMYRRTHPDDAARIADAAVRFATDESEHYEVIYRSEADTPSGYMIIHACGKHTYTADGTRLAYVWYTDEGAYESSAEAGAPQVGASLSKALHAESLLQASRYDTLTGLPSMTHFFELAHSGRKAILEAGGQPALLYTNLSGMKHYNRRHGFAGGDELLRSFSQLLAQRFGSDCCCRIGQDHFAAFCDAYAQPGIEANLRGLFTDFKELVGTENVGVKVGVYSESMGHVDVSTSCDRAHYACNAAGSDYHSRYEYYNRSMEEEQELRQYLIDNLDRALEERWVKVFYQPIVRAANGRVCDEEGLARWMDPERGPLAPSAFIPVLEEAQLIYKLDLYMVDRILEKLRDQAAAGLYLVPQSVNLSRSDFDACDMVEEIRRRVDEAGVGRDKITIEITESVIGRDFEFMKRQVERFRDLGFQVWMDDFGSGYSSLDVLQSIRFDLIKFDMHFMRQFDEGDKSRIILTELVRMTLSLGLDSVCEGVEREDQVRFLREIGCSKLQGYYYTKPIPMEEIVRRNRLGIQIGFENPEETEYYSTLGHINLYDLTAITHEDANVLDHYFDTVPVALMEVQDGKARYTRYNNSYRSFMTHSFGEDSLNITLDLTQAPEGIGAQFFQALQRCSSGSERVMINERITPTSRAHTFLRHVVTNPVTNTQAIAIAILAVMEDDPSTETSYSSIASVLAADYVYLYYVDLETGHYTQYSSDALHEHLDEELQGENFFAQSVTVARQIIYEDDLPFFLASFTRDQVLRAIDEQGAFTLGYRQLIDGKPTYVSMKAMRMSHDSTHLIIGVSNVDAQMRHKEELERIRAEETTYARIRALAGDFIAIYTVDLDTNHYYEYSSSFTFDGLGIRKEGDDFFGESRKNALDAVLPQDLPLFLENFSKEQILREIENKGTYVLRYHLIIDGSPLCVDLRGAIVQEKDGPQLIIGLNRVESAREREW